MERYMTMKEVAEELGLPLPSVKRFVREGKIPSLRIGKRTVRVPGSWVEEVKKELARVREEVPPGRFVEELRRGRVAG